MPRQTTLIPAQPVLRIFKRAGAPRVSRQAITKVVETLTKVSERVSVKAAEIAKHRGSRTINQGDVELALK